MNQAKTDKWVAGLNRLGREMDEAATTMHPSAWHEQLAPDREKWLKLARAWAADHHLRADIQPHGLGAQRPDVAGGGG